MVTDNDLAIIAHPKWLDTLIELLQDYDKQVVQNSFDALVNIAGSLHLSDETARFLVVLERYFFDPSNDDLVLQALDGLTNLAENVENKDYLKELSAEFFHRLVELLWYNDQRIQQQAIRLLYHMSEYGMPIRTLIAHEKYGVQHLINLLLLPREDFEDKDLRLKIARILANLASPPANNDLFLTCEHYFIHLLIEEENERIREILQELIVDLHR